MAESGQSSVKSFDARYYSKAPITEAVIDISIEPPEGFDLGSSKQLFVDAFKPAYSFKDSVHKKEFQISLKKDDHKTVTSQHLDRHRFIDPTEKNIIQVKNNGFSFSRLAPYEKWEVFSAEAKKNWEIYRALLEINKITRLAVRYINKIDIPTSADFNLYLRTYPEISKSMSQGISSFFMQVQLPQDDISCTALINQTIVPSPTPLIGSVLLDIDLFRTFELGFNEKEIWEFFEVLRRRKDEIFEACITDLVREDIK